MWDDAENMDDEFDPERERKRVEAMPVYQKAEELRELTRRIIESIDDEHVRMIHSNCMLEDSIILSEKIAAAEAIDDYVQKMEHATVIKLHAKNLLVRSDSLIFQGQLPKEYMSLLRKEIETFRLLFREWIKTFGESEKRDDGWGLFT
jgi:hypothetical protein